MPETAPVIEQIDPEIQKDIKDLEENYAAAPDGSVVKINDYLENPETPRDETES